MLKLLVVISSLIIGCYTAYTNASCAVLTDKQITAVRQPLAQLLTIKDDNAEYGYVKPIAMANITNLKAALTSLIDARMACEGTFTTKPETIQKDLLQVLKLSELDESQAIYGYDLQISVQQPPATVGLLLIHISFGIPCGEDNILLAYRFRENAWHRDLTWQSQPYNNIAGAYGDYYDYLLLPTASNGQPKLVIIQGTPWCTAAWNPLSINLVRLADNKEQQATLLHKQLIIYTGGEYNLVLKALASGFEVQADVGMLDNDLLTRKGIYRYRIDGDKVTREQPLATNVRDFVDEWLTLNLASTRRFSDKINADSLIQLQLSLKERYGFYGAVKQCVNKEPLYQVEMTFNGTKDNDKEQTYYFLVQPLKQGYQMYNASTQANPSCKGSDIMEK